MNRVLGTIMVILVFLSASSFGETSDYIWIEGESSKGTNMELRKEPQASGGEMLVIASKLDQYYYANYTFEVAQSSSYILWLGGSHQNWHRRSPIEWAIDDGKFVSAEGLPNQDKYGLDSGWVWTKLGEVVLKKGTHLAKIRSNKFNSKYNNINFRIDAIVMVRKDRVLTPREIQEEEAKLLGFPTYVCKKAKEVIQIDGKLDEVSWREAEGINLSLIDGSLPKYATEAKLLWNKEALYISFFCTDPDIWGTMSKRDNPVYNEEVVEAFIDPDCDGKNYLEFEVSSLNTLLDLWILEPQLLKFYDRWKAWNAEDIRTGVTADGTINDWKDRDSSWSVEIAIGWNSFKGAGAKKLPPKDGDAWRINLYRIERPLYADPEDSSWSPTHSFHAPERFGKVIFSRQ